MSADNHTALRLDQTFIASMIPEGARVLDLGCGDGALLAVLVRTRNVTGYGLEIDTDKVIACVGAGVNVIQTDLDDGLQTFDDHSFDVVILSQTLQAVKFPDRLLSEMVRVGGEGIVTFNNYGHWRYRLQMLMGHVPVGGPRMGHWFDNSNIHMCTVADFEALCADRGIEVLQRSALDGAPGGSLATRYLPNLFTEGAVYRIRRRRS